PRTRLGKHAIRELRLDGRDEAVEVLRELGDLRRTGHAHRIRGRGVTHALHRPAQRVYRSDDTPVNEESAKQYRDDPDGHYREAAKEQVHRARYDRALLRAGEYLPTRCAGHRLSVHAWDVVEVWTRGS